MRIPFPEQDDGVLYLTEGGPETEIKYRHGYDFPEFAMFTLLDDPVAMRAVFKMYQRFLDVAVEYGLAVIMGGLDYRASPDWARKLGYSPEALADLQHRAIGFLRDVAEPYKDQLPQILITGVVGPRGDAYTHDHAITAEEAEDYHSVQMQTLKEADVDLAWGATVNNTPEAVGMARAAFNAELPFYLSFTLDRNHQLKSGPSLKEAVETVDAEAGEQRPDFYGINCSHPYEFMPALEPGDWFLRVRSLRPNAAMMDKIALCQLGRLEEGDPVELGQLMGGLARRYPHIDIWGGCCGSWDKHLREIARNVLRARRRAG